MTFVPAAPLLGNHSFLFEKRKESKEKPDPQNCVLLLDFLEKPLVKFFFDSFFF